MRKELKTAMIVVVSVSVALCVLLLLAGVLTTDHPAGKAALKPAHIAGEYRADGGDWQPFDGSVGAGHSIIEWRGHFTEAIPARELLVLAPDNIQVTMLLNGEPVYQFGEQGSFPGFAGIPGSDIAFYRSPGITPADTVEFRLKAYSKTLSAHRFNKLLTTLQAGYAYALYNEMIEVCGLPLLLGVCIMMVGAVVFVLSLVLWRTDTGALKKGLSFAFFAFVGGFYSITDAVYFFLPLLIPNPVLCNFVDVAPLFLIVPSYCLYFYANLEHGKSKSVMAAVTIVQGAVSIIAFSAQLVGWLDVYRLQLIALIPGLAGTMIGAGCLIFEGLRCKNSAASFTILSFLPLCVAAILDVFNVIDPFMPYRILFRWGIIVTIVLQAYQLANFAKKRHEEILRRQQMEEKMAESRIAVMLSQIQPHFLYNTLNSISALCVRNPEKAEELVDQFAEFLRGNLDSLTAREPIPFSQEKRHLEIYLAIEKTRFGEVLNVEYDYKVTDFRLPPLILQPIVENAVRYGVTKKQGGGTVRISTWETDGAFLLRVADDGAGFVVGQQAADGRNHIGLSNVADRLRAQCGGSFQVESSPGKGTIVTITIPKQEVSADEIRGGG